MVFGPFIAPPSEAMVGILVGPNRLVAGRRCETNGAGRVPAGSAHGPGRTILTSFLAGEADCRVPAYCSMAFVLRISSTHGDLRQGARASAASESSSPASAP